MSLRLLLALSGSLEILAGLVGTDSSGRHNDIPAGRPVDAESHRLYEIVPQNLTWTAGSSNFLRATTPPMGINDLDAARSEKGEVRAAGKRFPGSAANEWGLQNQSKFCSPENEISR